MSQTKVTDAVRDVTVVDGAKITTGTIPEARITTLAATKLTGSIDAARVPAGAVTQHVQATDLTAVHQAIATLGLHTAVSDNKAAFNLPNAFIDTFEDDTGIATETTVDRDTSEYISTISTTFGSPVLGNGVRTSSITVTSNVTVATGAVVNLVSGNGGTANADNAQTTSHAFDWAAHTPSAGTYVRFEFGSAIRATEIEWFQQGTGTNGTWKWQGSNTAGGTSGYVDLTSAMPFTGVRESNPTNTASNKDNYVVTADLSSNNTAYKYYQIMYVSGAVLYYWNEEVEFTTTPVTESTNATGTLVSDAQTAPEAKTEVSGVILYTDGAGTNTIGTDLKIYMTANLQGTTPNWTGTNWTEASSYGTAQTFSGTTKQVKLGKTTVTSGTAVALKGVWANQSEGSKVAQLNGWAVNY